MGIGAGQLAASLARLARLETEDPEPATVVRRVVDAAVELFAIDGAGMLLFSPDEALRHLADSDPAAKAFEDAQEKLGDGPCVAAYVTDGPVCVRDLGTDPRWPELADVADKGVRSVCGVPVRFSGTPIGTLNVYRHDEHDWEESEQRALIRYGDVIGELLGTSAARHRSDETASQLRHALDYRVPIERAIGYLMASGGLDSTTAFTRMRSSARNSRRKIVDVAADVLDGKPLS